MNAILAEKYGWVSKEAEQSHAYLLPEVTGILKKQKVTSLLDIGTGNGATLPVWLSLGIKVTAMEPDEDGFLFARKHVAADVRQIGLGEALPPEWQNAFDGIISLEVVEHLFDPAQMAKAAGYSLKPGGIAIISTPYHGYLKNIALAVAGKWDFHHHPLRVGGHVKFWSRHTLSSLFFNEGFREVSFKGVGRVPLLWKSMIMVFRKF